MPVPQRCRHETVWAKVALRSEAGPPTLAGYASKFDSWTTLYRSKWYEIREVIRPGAFRNAIAESQDVRALFNHEPDNVLGRTAAGTLRLAEDSKGLRVEIDPPDDEWSRRIVGLVKRGDVDQMSFAFWPRDGGEVLHIRKEGEIEIWETEITDVDLFDVAPVTYPAYKDTSIGLRGGFTPAVADRLKRAKSSWLKEARAKSDQLARRFAAV